MRATLEQEIHEQQMQDSYFYESKREYEEEPITKKQLQKEKLLDNFMNSEEFQEMLRKYENN